MGARALKRLIEHKVVNRLSKAVLEGKILRDTAIELYKDGDKILFRQKK